MKTLLVFTCTCLLALTLAKFDVQKHQLKLQNQLRKEHHAVNLKSDHKLVKIAEKCAKRCAKKNSVTHDCPDAEHLGENIAYHTDKSKVPNAQQVSIKAFNLWKKEEKDYDYKAGASKNRHGIYHFSQMAWNGSRKLGCATAENQKRKRIFIFCCYDPPGNIRGRFTRNVFDDDDDDEDDDDDD